MHDYTERIYVFQLAFSSQHTRNATYHRLATWDAYRLPLNPEEFDWRTFQQEYRNYIDLAKMAKLLPFVGAAVGATANYKLIAQLGHTAQNCYRMRYFAREDKLLATAEGPYSRYNIPGAGCLASALHNPKGAEI